MTPEEHLDAGDVIEVGGARVMDRQAYLLSIGYTADGKPGSITTRFGQAEWWLQKSGAWIRIADMAPGHRYNTAAMLMRDAGSLAFKHAMAFSIDVSRHDGGDMAHDVLEGIAADLIQQAAIDPAGWLRSAALYRALTAGLTIQGDGTEPWQKTGRDPVTGEPTEVPPRMARS